MDNGPARRQLSWVPAELSQGRNAAEMFFQEIVPGQKRCPLSLGEKWFQILAFVFMENGEKFEGKPQKPFAFIETAEID